MSDDAKIGNGFCGDNTLLLCPVCGDGYLHHRTTTDYAREHEDCDIGRITTVTKNAVITGHGTMENNPSTRRDGLLLSFECESGCNVPCLCIAQHKGSTAIYWSDK